MSWNQQGHTWKRTIPDQSASVNAGGQVVTANFNNIRTLGLLKSLRLSSAYQAATVTLAGGTLAPGPVLQMSQLRQIDHLRLQLQGVAPLYDVDGPDLGYLAYTGHGRPKQDRKKLAGLLGYAATAVPTTNVPEFAWPSPTTGSPVGLANLYAPVVEYVAGGPSLALGYNMELPVTEYITFPNTPMGAAGQNGPAINLDAELEVGMLFMQTAQQNLTPYVNIAALYGTSQRAVLQATGAATATSPNQVWSFENTYYDLPSDPADMPNQYQLSMVCTRTATDHAVSGGLYTHQFQRAGLLLRAIYCFYNDTSVNGTLIDITQTPAATAELKSGGSVIILSETIGANARRSWSRYGTPPPGVAIHDFIYNGAITDALDTGALLDLRTEFTGLPGSITRCHVIEQRLISLKTS